ncbi:putative Exo-beta-1,3-glucanae [Rhizodiscina lignyota]|uniref:Exo-beta-1,3-glucanae n=1 Tax=Rhizodiscina lignyota TaxID=1504668 RepID=A0A9P4I8A6_9PEZI|nr:putative Exo-beta-1,3-glucanae [Rhizodiscina lignyota]
MTTSNKGESRLPPLRSAYWFEQMQHQGKASFNSNSTYQVWRSVKDFGAKGDGVTDDTAAINSAISSGNRCAPGACQSSTTTPATVYFPPGTYVVSSSIIDYYYTNLIGHPVCLPVLKATSGFTGLGVIDGNQYQAGGVLGFGSTNTFYRQIRNFIIDTTGVPAASSMTGIHWPTAQATSIQNVEFRMSAASGTQHQGLFIEEGSGGYVGDLRFSGGLYALNVGNQQFTMRNITITNAVTAINQLWDWGWTYSGISISNCQLALNMSADNRTSQEVMSVTLIDSTISNTPVGILTSHDSTSSPTAGGSIIMENIQITNVSTIVKEITGRTVFAGTSGSLTVAAWGEGHYYSPTGPNSFERSIGANSRPSSLITTSNKYYSRSKPQYETLSAASFLSVRTEGAKGDGATDDTKALQAVINSASAAGKVVFFDAGYYKVTKTLYIPSGSRITGESYPVIMSSGSFFANMKSPKAVVQVGNVGETGSVEWSDMIVSTQGAQAGASLIQWNLAASSSAPSGMWDVHVRVGGFTGSQLQVSQCPTTPGTATPPATPKASCISDFLSMHITTSASGLYMENCWIWTADHDIDDPNSTQITVYSGRGLLVDSSAGNIWLVGTAVEHHSLYQYQFTNTANVFMGQIQTESAYYQPNPDALSPFTALASINDPTFNVSSTTNTANGWGLRITDSKNILVYGAGLYSFFDNYSAACSQNQLNQCQYRILSVEGSVANVNVYGLSTVGTACMIARDGKCQAAAKDNVAKFVDTIALYRAS